MTQAAINPRVVVFLAAHGLPLDTLVRDSEGEIKRITINGESLPWNVHYSFWIGDRTLEWATMLGVKQQGGGRLHEHAIMAGHTYEEFDAWLAAKYGGTTDG